ncbi:hypothetical protein D0Z00_001400 [Geotrichum galactomycetum]|uniref:Uncharacterized protein n=1 Tax=Geotrichum galactomycetum TaxID=27317 RepID=A0ACB6V705_9ASCO|nr:hypothetical protein D0Z00_001400 [Geotrichum candidum]
MVKSYLRFEQESSFGVVSSKSNLVWLPPRSNTSSGGRVIVGGLEDVLTWDLKTATLLSRWNEGSDNNSAHSTSEVTSVADYEGQMVATGYANGVIKVWDSLSGSLVVSFNGHKSEVTVLKFDATGTRLASGSRDSNIILWDLVGEVGLYRLRSHRDQIVALDFLRGSSKIQTGDNDEEEEELEEDENWLLSTGKDGLIKLWDLEAQHCIETHVAHRGEAWGMGFNSTHNIAITSGSGQELKFWSINLNETDGQRVKDIGVINKQSPARGHTILFNKDNKHVAIANADKTVEIFRIRSAEEIKKSVARKLKRRKEKGLNVEPGSEYAISEDDVTEKFVLYTNIRLPAKVKSIDWTSSTASHIGLVVSTINNSIETYTISAPINGKTSKSNGLADYTRQYAIDLPGHRTDIRALSISSDDRMVASASNGSLKVWNIRNRNCIRTFECGYALCASFLPGDALILVGTKEGHLSLYDVASSSLIETVEDAHPGSVWSLDVGSDGKTIVTCGSDKTVKFWEIKVAEERVPGTTQKTIKMKLKHARTLELGDEVMSVKLSPDMKLIAASLLDHTVKVFFTDTLKFFLSLYGHKMPVLTMDISHDSKLLVTGSADKNIKIWGLDFGDCHRSIFAHQDPITGVAFEPETHNLFSVGRDKMVKYWDGDKFENIQKLEGHQSDVWSLAVAHSGDFIVTGSHDKSIRVWVRTDEPLFLEEEREKELEELYESNLTKSFDDDSLGPLQRGQGDDLEDSEMANHDDETHVARAGKQTIETLKAGERLMEALDIGKADLELQAEYQETLKKNPKAAMPTRNVILAALNVSAEKYVMDVMARIKAAQLEDALLVLPFDKVITLFVFIDKWAHHRWNIPLVSRVLSVALKIHHKQIVANQIMRPTLESLRGALRAGLELHKNQIGYNIAGLKFLKQNWELHHKKEFIDETQQREEEERLTKKRTFTTASV